ncbi:MAG: alpha-L-fucosidase [Lentisphaerae bacterium]|nr:alpha-L-fucosidase [Lentisphaerota bacterium]
MTSDSARHDRMAWWHDAKFGMFVHWGCYSLLGRGEQVMLRDMMPLDEYGRLACDFRPAADWADRVADQAVRAGARYIVLTARHHDGYCLFKTATHHFNAPQTGPGRDLIAEYVAAARARGLRVGLYYSLINWRWRGFWNPAGYPDELPRIVEEIHTQVRELMTQYGRIDILYYDTPLVPGAHTPGSSGYAACPLDQTPAAFYRSAELNRAVRALQPDILINDRSGVPEDFGTPEQRITPEREGRAWETCMTLNDAPNWANIPYSFADKTAGQVIRNLMDAVRQGGNFLFNIGPDARGHVAARDRAVLDRVGRWLQAHGEAVYGTRPGGIYRLPEQGPCYHYGMFTCRGSTAYLTLFYYPGDYLVISKVEPAVRRAELLTTGARLTVEPLSNFRWKIGGLPSAPPDDLPPVLKLEFEAPPRRHGFSGDAWLDGRAP